MPTDEIRNGKSPLEMFPGHRRRAPAELKELWKEALFTYDANVLLNTYRYPESTQRDLLNVFERAAPRTFLTKQAVSEFLTNRATVINQQCAEYTATKKLADQLSEKLSSDRQHPFVDSEFLLQFNEHLKTLNSDLEKKQESHATLLANDWILRKIDEIFAGCVISSTDEEVDSFRKKAVSRYEKKQPPGYCDTQKDDESKYGDAVLWLQVLKASQGLGRDLILVTDDTKEDWWYRVSGKTLGARPELLQEYFDVTGHRLHIYQPAEFIGFAAKHFAIHIDDQSTKYAELVTQEKSRAYQSRLAKKRQRMRDAHAHSHGHRVGEIEYDTRDEPLPVLSHLDAHVDDAQDLVHRLRQVPESFWDSSESLFELPPDVVDRIGRVLRRCPCLRGIIRGLRNLTVSQIYEAQESGEVSHLATSVAVALKRLPPAAINVVLDTDLGRHGD